MAKIPELINNYNVYDGSNNKLVGVSGSVTLPSFDAMTATVSGAGIFGEISSPVTGHFSSMEMQIPFRVLYDGHAQYLTGAVKTFKLRGSVQVTDASTGELEYQPLVITVKGRVKKFEPGKAEVANSMDASITIELQYIYIQENNNSVVKLDKLNGTYEVDGVDQMSAATKYC